MNRFVLIVMLLMCTGCACSTSQKPASSPAPSSSPEPQVKEAYNVTGEETQFGTPIVSLKMKEGKIVELSIDEITGESTKKSLGDDYKLPEGAKDTWSNQIKALEEYIVNHGLDKIQVDAQGKALNEDLLSGCTIQIDNYLKTVRQAMNEAE